MGGDGRNLAFKLLDQLDSESRKRALLTRGERVSFMPQADSTPDVYYELCNFFQPYLCNFPGGQRVQLNHVFGNMGSEKKLECLTTSVMRNWTFKGVIPEPADILDPANTKVFREQGTLMTDSSLLDRMVTSGNLGTSNDASARAELCATFSELRPPYDYQALEKLSPEKYGMVQAWVHNFRAQRFQVAVHPIPTPA